MKKRSYNYHRIQNGLDNNQEEKSKNCVILIRAKDQVSHDVQKSACEEHAQKNGLTVIQIFGLGNIPPTREEFKRMLTFVTKNSARLAYIIVHSMDRFSRTGEAAIVTMNRLQTKFGISVIPVYPPTTDDSSYGNFLKYLRLIMAKSDNKIRSEKILHGMRKRVENGQWLGHPRLGYTAVGDGR